MAESLNHTRVSRLNPGRGILRLLTGTVAAIVLLSAARPSPAAKPKRPAHLSAPRAVNGHFESLRLAIADLAESFGPRYPRGRQYLERLRALEAAAGSGDPAAGAKLRRLKQEALLDNPLLHFDRLLVLKRERGQLGLPVNHKCNAGIAQTGYDNEIAVLSPVRPGGRLRTLFRPRGSEYVGEIDLDFDGRRLLFTMPNGRTWQIHEIRTDGSGLRQVSRERPGVDNFDACYLPDGRIVFASTASFTAVPCWHGQQRACCLYSMNADGSGLRQLCFDQDLDLHPSVLPDGQVIYSRWDYSGPMHIYLRPLMVMNPDGSGQRAVYGSNSYWPNALYFPRGIPGSPGKIIAVLSGYHGVPRMGELVLLDTARGWYEADGVVQRIPGRGKPVRPVTRDKLVDRSWPKFLHPYPLSGKYFLVAAQPAARAPWGIYLVDVFDNMVPIRVDPKFDFFEPIPLRRTPRPPVLPDRVDPARDDAAVYLHDVYAGPGLAGVPRGTVRRLRIVAYQFGYPGLAGPDKIGRAGPWEAMRILGTVPVHEDGSTVFRIPASTPITVQPLDAEGKALQLMRSWFTAMPGETVSCVGCHEQPPDTPAVRYEAAATRPPDPIEPWYGPARGFDFEREVQPVLDKYCVGCHDGRPRPDGRRIADLRSERLVQGYRGLPLSKLGADRLHPDVRKALGGTNARYTPAYDALVPFVRRVNVEDDVALHVPGEYHADTSELVQMLRKGHFGVHLDGQSWDRLVTWIDLNAPCHGTWGDICAVPEGADRRRQELARLCGGPKEGPEAVPEIARPPVEPVLSQPPAGPSAGEPACPGWPFDAAEAARRQAAAGVPIERQIELGGGVTMKLARIPAGQFVMGQADGEPDEQPLARVVIPEPFWMGVCEVTNQQYRRFDPSHESGYFAKRFQGADGPGLSLDGPRQPVVRVSWLRAMAFCRWLSQKTGMEFTLPTEAQWEYACRAGSAAPLSFGGPEADFSRHANMADLALGRRPTATGGLLLLVDIPHDRRFDDGAVATAAAGSYLPNAWGLYDMHGNAAEWTLSRYAPYPYRDDGRNSATSGGRKVARGGSFRDRPKRCRAAFRLSYPAWQRVHDVGFRVVCRHAVGG
jgi:formylglycine-generating enzyme required for sulfatase activity